MFSTPQQTGSQWVLEWLYYRHLKLAAVAILNFLLALTVWYRLFLANSTLSSALYL